MENTEVKHEVVCPSCDATIRARMADRPDELLGRIEQLEEAVSNLADTVGDLALYVLRHSHPLDHTHDSVGQP